MSENEKVTKCDELNVTPIPHIPMLLVGFEVAKSGVRLSPEIREGCEAEPRNKGGMRGSDFKIGVYFSLPYSDFDW